MMKSFKEFLLSEKHTYHGTAAANLDSIRQFGLHPNDFGNPLNFHDIKDSAKDYAGKDGHLFRVKQKNLPKHTYDALTARRWTRQPVDPKYIEIYQGGKWRTL